MELTPGHCCHPHVGQDLRAQVQRKIPDSKSPSYSPGPSNLGNSFQALLHVPASPLECNIHELSNTRSPGVSVRLPVEVSNIALGASGNQVPTLYGGPLSSISQNLHNRMDACAAIGSYSGGNSSYHYGSRASNYFSQGSGMTSVVSHQMFADNADPQAFSSLKRDVPNTISISSSELQEMNHHRSKRSSLMSVPSNCSSSLTSGCPPLVFCMVTSGHLLLSNMGLLGVRCSCHCFRMSVSKFCEHSGLCNVNPGDAVLMDSGETIGQWRKLYFQKFGIRVPEDQSGWDWPDEPHLTASLMKTEAPLPSTFKHSDSNHSIGLPEGLARSGLPGETAVFPKSHLEGKNPVIDVLHFRKQVNNQDSGNFLLKGPIGTWKNQRVSVSEQLTMTKTTDRDLKNACQSMLNDVIKKTGSFSSTQPNMQNLGPLMRSNHISRAKNEKVVPLERDSGGSSMELRLGQPYQQVQCSGGPCLSIMVPHLNNTAVHPKKLCPQQQIMNNVSTQKGFVAGASDSSRRTKDEKHATGNCIVIGNLDKVEVSKNSLAPLFTHLSSPAEGSSAIKATTQIINTAEHIPPLAQDHVAVRSKQGLVSASWTNTNNLENRCTHHEFGVFIPANNHMKEMHASGSSFSVAGSGSKVQVQENHCSFSGGASLNNAFCLPAAHDKNHSHHIARVPPDTSDPGKFSNYFRKIPCFSSNRHANHVLLATSGSCKDPIQVLPVESLPMGYPLSTSTSNSGLTPVMLKQDMSSNLLTDNRQSLAVRQILPLSNQQHQMSSVSENLDQRNSPDSYNLKRRKFVNELPLFGESNVPDLTRETDVAELTVQSSTCYKLSNATDFASRSGLTDGCTSSKLIHGIPHSSMEIEMRSRISHISLGFERALPRHGSCQKTNSVTEHGVFCSTALNHQENDNCKCQTKGHGGRYEFIVDNPSNSSTEETETIYNKGHNLTTISSQFIEDHRAAKGTDISSTELGNITGKQPRNFTCLASQWKDVPSKKKRIDNVVSVKQAVDKSINLGTRWDKSCQLEDTFANCSNVAVLVKDSFEEQEISDISSGCSAPAATTVSTEVNNVVSSTVAHGMENENTLPYDEGSGIDKCCSSYDALDDDKTFEFNGSTCKSNLIKGSDEAINESPRSLLEEIKLLNSLAWKRGRNQITSGNLCAKTNHLQQCEGLKIRKRKSDEITVMPDASFGTTVCAICNTGQETSHVSGACSMKNSSLDGKYTSSIATKPSRKRDLTMFYTEGLIEIDQKINLEGNTNCSRNPLNSSRKKGKRTRSSDGSTQALSEKAGYCGPGSLGKVNKSQTVNLCITKPRPVVCGKFGEICSSGVNFDVSFRKPAKLVSLDKILKNTKRCALPKYCETDLILPSCGRSYTCSNKHSNFVDNKEKGESDTSVSHKIDLLTSTKDRKTMSYSLDNESVCKTLPQEREKDDKRSHAQSKPKEVRERSLYELTFKGNSCTAMLSHKLFDIARKAKKAVKFPKGLLRGSHRGGSTRNIQDRQHWCHKDSDTFCCVCGRLNEDEMNCLLECGSCSIRVHQTCYGVPKAPKGHWYCRPCKTNSKDIVCVLCGYGGGAMTQALRTQTIVKSLLKAWNFGSECGDTTVSSAKASHDELSLLLSSGSELEDYHPCAALGNGPLTSIASNAKIMRKGIDNIEGHLMFQGNLKRHNSIVAGVTDSTVKQWIHMVCGLWTPGTRCPNVYTMSAFDVSGVSLPRANVVCSICNRPGGSCIRCRAANCTIRFHPWCAQKKGLLQSEAEGVDNENIGFYGSCLLHATCSTNEDACDFPNMDTNCQQKEFSCSRTEGYKGRKKDGFWYDKIGCQSERKRGFVPQEQLNAWIHINQQKSSVLRMSELPTSDVETDCRKEYARYKQTGGWRHLVVYKSGIHALGLYTSRFISRGEMVVEYVGEIIGSRVADKRENDYQLGRKLQYKSACYFFRIDKEHIIDATRKGGIARFVNHSCLPNCVAKVIQMRNEKKVVFFAERDIYPGEEITYDYHFNHEDDGEKIPCFCNAKNCRRYLN